MFNHKLYIALLATAKWSFLEARTDQFYEYFAAWFWNSHQWAIDMSPVIWWCLL